MLTLMPAEREPRQRNILLRIMQSAKLPGPIVRTLPLKEYWRPVCRPGEVCACMSQSRRETTALTAPARTLSLQVDTSFRLVD